MNKNYLSCFKFFFLFCYFKCLPMFPGKPVLLLTKSGYFNVYKIVSNIMKQTLLTEYVGD